MRFLAHYTVYNGSILHLNVIDLEDNNVDYFPVKEETAHTLFIEGILLICEELSSGLQEELNRKLESIGLKPIKEIAETVNETIVKYRQNKKTKLCAYQIKDISLNRYYISKLQ